MKTKVRCTNFLSRTTGKVLGVLVALLMVMAPKVEATHLSGGSITYEHLSSNTYRVKLKIYRDCSGISLGTSQVVQLSPTNSGSSFSVTRTSVTDITPLCPGQVSNCSGGSIPGYEEHVYEGNVTLNPLPGGAFYTMFWQSCCRNFAITTLNNPGNTGFYLSTQLNPSLSTRNSSPDFLNPPIAVLCSGQPATISPNAADPNGDVLVYSLTACLDQGGGSVSYGAGRSATSPLATSGGINLNTSTGLLSFTPSGIQVGVICTKVEEYRAGVKIGEIVRDIQVRVISCNNTPPVVAPITNQIAQVGVQLCVPVSATDANNDNITLTATSSVGSFTLGTSGAGFANGTFCFTPTLAQQGQTFTVTINAVDDACPSPGTGVTAFNITVPAVQCSLSINATSTSASCNQSDGTASVTQSGGITPISYNWSNGASTQNISGLAPGSYTVTVVDGYNCVETATVSVGGGSTNIAATASTSNPSCPSSNDGSITVNTTGGVAPISYSLNGGTAQSSNTFSGLGVGSYTITVTDASGCPGISISASLSSVDNTAPQISCPANVTVPCGSSTAPAATGTATATDNCTSVTITSSDQTNMGNCAGNYIITRVWTATDAYGNSSSCTQVINVVDNVAPVVSCSRNLTRDNDAGQCGANVSFMATASDNCSGSTVTTSHNSGSFFPIGTTTVTVTGTDGCGNSASCNFTITVNDVENPTISCPSNVVVSNDAGVCGAAVSYSVSSADNCPGSSLSQTGGLASGATFPIGATTNSFTVTDASGNTANCAFIVTVNDTEDPMLVCPGNISVNNDAGVCGAVVNYGVSASDNCPNVTVSQNGGLASGSTFPIGTTSQSYTATDASGNAVSCSFDVTVTDNEAPVISCPGNISVSNDAGVCGAAVSYNVSSSDNCPGSSVAQNGGQASGSTFPIGTTTNSFTVTDASGNTASCSFTVTVTDTEDPVISCSGNISVNNDPGVCGAAVSYNVSSSDNCPGSSLAQTAGQASGSTFPIGTTSNSFTVTDAAGNTASCSFTVTVTDNENPTITCPANISVNNDPGVCGAAVTYAAVSTSDNCPGETAAQTAGLGSGSTFPIGSTTNAFVVTDASGNTANCSFTVTVTDAEAPVISCPSNITVNNDPGVCGAAVSYNVTSSDNCPGSTLAQNGGLSSGSTFPIGTTTNSFSVTDASGNTSSCSFDVTVNDNENPTITCPANISVNTDPGVCGAAVSYSVSTADNCPNETLAQTAGQASGSTFPVGTTTNSFTVTDASGNTASCSFTVSVTDNEAPVINCPGNISVNNDAGVCGAAVSYSITTSDNCPGETWVQNAGLTSGSTYPVGTTTNSFTATDAHGNTSSCSFDVTVTDNEAPSITCPADESLECLRDIPAPNTALVQSSDNCAVASVVHSGDTDNGGSGCAGDPLVISRTYTATDIYGNSSSCVQTISVESTPVVATASPNAVVFINFQDSACTDISVAAMGGCPGYTYQWDNGATTASQTVCPTVTTVYTVTVTDAEGCTGVDDVKVCVIDASCTAQTNNGQGGSGQSGNGVNNSPNAMIHITMCHIPPGNPANAMTKCLPVPAAQAHFAQGHGGDYLGACGSLATRTCDDDSLAKKTSDFAGVAPIEVDGFVEAYPNPFTHFTNIDVQISKTSAATVVVYDMKGVEVATLFEGVLEGGVKASMKFNGNSLSGGMYFVRLVTEEGLVLHKKVNLQK